ncbi:MAG: phosphoglucosamine mutase [Bryobacteraceae bacterium]|nr:phosphoglucosamine mutase [Bryobacteraceae bacterium]
MARHLFGTDGIRGVAGQAPLDERTVRCFGLALGEWAAETARAHNVGSPRVVIGLDTRESGPWLAETVAGGLQARAVTPVFAGLTTTPGVAHLTRTLDFVAGVMISASHNPYQDNGLKAFDHSGFKLPDSTEIELERRIFALLEDPADVPRAPLVEDPSLDRLYLDSLASTFKASLAGRRIVIDCANGAASRLGPELFSRLGADVIATSCSPDGRNINLHCGALHLDPLKARVLAEKAWAGVTFDGDADRCMMIAPSGRIIDGDHSLLIYALHTRPQKVVATQMSNLGLQLALEAAGIGLIRTAVGDRYVLERMIAESLPLGGEQSGHVIFRDYSTTGDGMLTALRILEIAAIQNCTLDDLAAPMTVYPQILVNVRFREKKPLEQLPEVQRTIREVESQFGSEGRVFVRFSGTELLARVMVEGPSRQSVEAGARSIARAIAEALGERE